MKKQKKNILFLCTGNSCRSQMAEGFMRHYYGEKFNAYSAGISPSVVNPKAIEVMKEIGIDISEQTSKSVEYFVDKSFDYLITVCDHARETCPLFTGEVKTRLQWGFEDPADANGTQEEILRKFREVRNLIKDKILEFFNAYNKL